MTKAAWLSTSGRFQRKQSEFRRRIGEEPFDFDVSRYHLYVQYACPWAHRTLLTRTLLGLDDITVDVVSWRMQQDGRWIFEPELDGATTDRLHGRTDLQDTYHAADPSFPGIGTVPVLWDKATDTIVNNESREIVRMLGHLATQTGAKGPVATLLPTGLEAEVDAMIDANYESVNNGVYKCGFAKTQEAYDEAWPALFDRLEWLDAHLADRDWLVGPGRGVLTEADVCLWPTLVRFDPVYHTHFKCNRKLIRQLPNLWAYVKRFYALPGVAETVNMEHIRHHYYWSHTGLNPHRIVPVGPELDLD